MKTVKFTEMVHKNIFNLREEAKFKRLFVSENVSFKMLYKLNNQEILLNSIRDFKEFQTKKNLNLYLQTNPTDYRSFFCFIFMNFKKFRTKKYLKIFLNMHENAIKYIEEYFFWENRDVNDLDLFLFLVYNIKKLRTKKNLSEVALYGIKEPTTI